MVVVTHFVFITENMIEFILNFNILEPPKIMCTLLKKNKIKIKKLFLKSVVTNSKLHDNHEFSLFP